MKFNQVSKLAAAVALAAASMSASAALIDFRDAAWGTAISGPPSTATAKVGGVTLTASNYGAQLGLTSYLTWSSTYGIGINTLVPVTGDPNQDEVGWLEKLTITFSSPTDVQSVLLNKFFKNESLLTGSEKFDISANGGAATSYTANNTNPFTATFPFTGANYLELKGNKFGSEASVQGINVASLPTPTNGEVPLPASLPLLGMGLVAFASLSRRRQSV